jgi:uracil-DNA glycosylase
MMNELQPADRNGNSARDLDALLAAVSRCRICVERPHGRPLPHEPRPVLRASSTARIMVCGQAPGTRVHASGAPFTDPSGMRLRQWMGIGEGVFYDTAKVAVVPMGFCFPGLDAKGSDLPPRRECAATWHDGLFSLVPHSGIIIALGTYAQRYHLARLGASELLRPTLHETVANWRPIHAATGVMPMPHPSWRNNAWIRRNPWFDDELVPVVRAEVSRILASEAP